MYNITLVNTRHENLGKCNSIELYKIFEIIKPEIIFEEIPPSYFEKYYITKIKSNLETDTVNNYIKNYKIQHIPVDSDNVPKEKFFNDFKRLFDRIEGQTNQNGFRFRNLIDQNKSHCSNYGFKYLNSIHSCNFNKKIEKIISDELEELNNDELNQIYKMWNDVNEMREKKMLENIYNYSKTNSYSRAIFMIGVAHRNSIIEKIKGFQENSKEKLNWIF